MLYFIALHFIDLTCFSTTFGQNVLPIDHFDLIKQIAIGLEILIEVIKAFIKIKIKTLSFSCLNYVKETMKIM